MKDKKRQKYMENKTYQLEMIYKSYLKIKSARNKDRWFNYIRKVNNKYF